MAIYSLQVKTVSRSQGRSVVAAAAYRAAQNIADDRLGVVWDFTSKRGVLHSEIIAPAGAPEWVYDRSELWNAAERTEDKSTRWQTATVGRDIILALPYELTHEQRLAAVREFAAGLVARYGVAVDFALHAPDRHSDERNHHAHLLMTTRRIGPNGFGAKTRELDGFRNGSLEIEAIRKMWEHIGNRALEQAGVDIRIDCRTLVDQGLDREATVHLGPVASGLERKGAATDIGDRNRAARTRNAERERMAGERDTASAEIIDLAAERARREQERELRAAVRSHHLPRVLDLLTDRRATFSRADLNRVLTKVIPDPVERADMTGRILALPDVVGLRETPDAPVSRYTTRSVLADEKRVLENAEALVADTRHGLHESRLAAGLAHHPQLNAEQRRAVRHGVSPEGLVLIAGEAGTGKSTTLAAIRDAYEAAGYRVVGMAWTNAIVQDMRRDGYRNAATIASELRALQTGASQWDGRTALIVDEAAMLSTRHLAEVIAQARLSGAKLILAGDDRQLASIERGGLFGALREQHGAAELHNVTRVSDSGQRRAFNLMHNREFLPALTIFDQQGAVHWEGRRDEAFGALVAHWAKDAAADPAKTRFVFAYTNADVGRLNAALRQVRQEQGMLGREHVLEVADGPTAFAENDRVQFTGTAQRRDFRAAGLVNGAAGTVRAIEGERMTVALDTKPGAPERLISFNVGKDYAAGEFDQLRHGYAGTIYKGQGRTLDQTYLYHTEHWHAESAYVALTRHRSDVSLFVAQNTTRDLGQLARQMARIDETRSASQFFVSEEPPVPPTPGQDSRRARISTLIARRDQRRADSSGGDRSGDAPDPYRELREARAAVEEARRLDEGRSRDRERDRGGRSR